MKLHRIIPIIGLLGFVYFTYRAIDIKYFGFKTVTKIESCASSGRCRVIFDDGTTDLVFNPYIGMKVSK